MRAELSSLDCFKLCHSAFAFVSWRAAYSARDDRLLHPRRLRTIPGLLAAMASDDAFQMKGSEDMLPDHVPSKIGSSASWAKGLLFSQVVHPSIAPIPSPSGGTALAFRTH